MSHFTVLVIGEDPEALLAPYDENKEVAPYWKPEAETPDSFWGTSLLQDKGELPEGPTFEEVIAAIKKCWGDDEGEFRVHDGRLERRTTYNPDSKWDWYALGGRWRGALRLKEGAEGYLTGPHWTETMGGQEPEEMEPWAVDAAKKCDIDIEGMREEAARKAGETHDQYTAMVAEHGAPIPWRVIADKHLTGLEGDELEAARNVARKEYHGQPVIKALDEAGLVGIFSGPERFDVSREAYVEKARLAAIPGFATLTKDGWFEKGRMGWFGMSNETDDSEMAYLKHANWLIDTAPDDAVLSVVDCHI